MYLPSPRMITFWLDSHESAFGYQLNHVEAARLGRVYTFKAYEVLPPHD